LIPSNSNTFSVGDGQLRPAYHISGFEVTDMVNTPAIIADFHTPERQNRAIAWFSRQPVISDPKMMDDAFYMTDLYNLIYREFDMHHLLWVPIVLDAANSGVLGLYRSRSQKPFGTQDQAQVMRLLPYIVHAWRAVDDAVCEFSQEGLSGMMILNPQGAILYQSQEVKLLLERARYPRMLVDLRKQDRLLMKLAELCRNLQTIYRGGEAPPQSFTHTGANGQFHFRAYWLNSHNKESGGLIGMTIEHCEPLILLCQIHSSST
jgi:hypothetical protein